MQTLAQVLGGLVLVTGFALGVWYLLRHVRIEGKKPLDQIKGEEDGK